MLNKIFLAVLAIAVITMGILTYIPFSWLARMGFAPSVIVDTFSYWNNLHFTVLWISSLILLIISNIILWTNRKPWAIWLSFLFFATFLMLNTWWLSESLLDYKKQNNLWDGSFQLGGIVAAVLVVIVGIGVFFNQFIVLRMREKMVGANKTEIIADKEVKEIQ